MGNKIGFDELVGTCTGNHSARKLITWFAGQGDLALTALNAVEKEVGEKIPHKEVVTFFKYLEEVEAGDFVVGRRGGVSRFEWKKPSQSFAAQVVVGLGPMPEDSVPMAAIEAPPAPVKEAVAATPKAKRGRPRKNKLAKPAKKARKRRARNLELHTEIQRLPMSPARKDISGGISITIRKDTVLSLRDVEQLSKLALSLSAA